MNQETVPVDPMHEILRFQERLIDLNVRTLLATAEQIKASQTYLNGLYRYFFDFMAPFWVALNSFQTMERIKLGEHAPDETVRDYLELFRFNLQIAKQGLMSTLRSANRYHAREWERAFAATLNTWAGADDRDILAYTERKSKILEELVYNYSRAIRNIEPEFGFHFDDGGYELAAETDRFLLYRVFPTDPSVKSRENGKPVIIIPPYVLGANILAFLPGEGKSYTHAFANQGIPTYIRIMKDVDATPALQVMTGEDDARDTRHFCETVMNRHGRPVTLNGFCQGGFISVLNILSGELDGLVDALITCVAPMDGTESQALVAYLEHIPMRFRDLGYALKAVPDGNEVVDGKVMSWVYKLKSMDRESPIFTFYRDLMMFDRPDNRDMKITKTAAALNHWLIYDRNDLPRAITQLSFDSYTIPVTPDGTLPVKLFGRTLNFRRIREKNIPWLLCYAAEDDLVNREAALAPLKYIDVEVTEFPKGHGGIATSWSQPESECALHTVFGDGCRGPVRFQLDLEAAPADSSRPESPVPKKRR
jgi:hypothetical protein